MLRLHAANPALRRILLAATVAVPTIAAHAPLVTAQPVQYADQEEVCDPGARSEKVLRWANQCDARILLADIRTRESEPADNGDRLAPLIKRDTSPLRLSPDDPGVPVPAEPMARGEALNSLQADADAVVSILERLERQGSSLQAIARDWRLSEELRLTVANAEELRSVLGQDTRELAAAIDDVFARGPANLPELGIDADRYHGLTDRLARKVNAILVALSDIEALEEVSSALNLHRQRLRERQAPPDRVATLEREAQWIEADRGERLSSLADAAKGLEESLRVLGQTTCAVYRRLHVDADAACRANDFVVQLSDLFETESAYYLFEAAPAVAAAAATPRPVSGRIRHSVYGFFDEKTREPKGYGLYTYVLFIRGSQNRAFVQELIDSTDIAGEISAADRRQLNLFSLPVKDAAQMPEVLTDAAWLLDREAYDYSTARSLLLRLCHNPEAAALDPCAGSAWRGPYLLTHPRPQSQLDVLEIPYLMVDLSHVRERAYGEFIRAIKEQVKRPDFTDRERIDTFRLRLLDITLTAADWVRPIHDGVQGIIFTSD